ncbi:hypothetical protein [Desulfopila aestuarii]|uniref:Uncharacterized protein n=1 Tax=Desulfopila aestuarii DSM 18488 TaxID=1121416 RepID=A0A1M7XZR4_9BACT|nr:hypothetical protein [Desulfopila aestuarii]SHO44676.1 hypothetical protein SAMN02745220_00837 [Desulfopila aestuarii DSM 18488]
MKTRTAISRSAAARKTESPADVLVYRAGLVGVGSVACAIGLWAVASLVGGLAASGGPLGLAGAWVNAVFGI